MSRCKVKSSRIVIAAMIILLCLISIIGATLALFTNRDDGKIGINVTSGKVKVDIVEAEGDPAASLVNDVLDFHVVDEKTEVLFEPGACYYTEGFRIKNLGNIPINYILYITEDKDLEKDFYDAFDVWITTDPKDRSTGIDIKDFGGSLGVDKSSEVYYLVFRMKESAGNEYQNRKFKGVGITVCAVQGNVGDQ